MRDAQRPGWRSGLVVGAVAIGHATSHMLQLALPAVFLLVQADLGTSYAALGAVMSAFYLVSALLQPIAGGVVDRIGGWRVLLGGLAILSGSLALAGSAPALPILAACMVAAGAGNSVFHPADLAILARTVPAPHLGAAFGVHQVAGTIGFVGAPLLSGLLAPELGWRGTLLAAAAFGALVGGLLIAARRIGVSAAPDRAHAPAAPRLGLVASLGLTWRMPAIRSAFVYFALISAAGLTVQGVGAVALTRLYGVRPEVAAGALVAYLAAVATGNLIGGAALDRLGHPDRLAVAGLGIAAAMLMLVASGLLPFGLAAAALALGGLASGATAPARDLLVRRAAGDQQVGSAFGAAYAGLDVGAALGPLAAGFVVDGGRPGGVMLLAAAILLVAIGAVRRMVRG